MGQETMDFGPFAHVKVDRAIKAVANFNPAAPCVCRFFDAETGEFIGWGYETGEIVAGPDGKDLPRQQWVRFRVVEYDHPFDE